MCRPPRHETHALPLERRRRRTSSCSNVHLVPVDTPTLRPRANGPRKKRRPSVRRLCRRKGNIEGPDDGECFIAPRGRLRGDNRVCARARARFRNSFFPRSSVLLPPLIRLFSPSTILLLCCASSSSSRRSLIIFRLTFPPRSDRY